MGSFERISMTTRYNPLDSATEDAGPARFTQSLIRKITFSNFIIVLFFEKPLILNSKVGHIFTYHEETHKKRNKRIIVWIRFLFCLYLVVAFVSGSGDAKTFCRESASVLVYSHTDTECVSAPHKDTDWLVSSPTQTQF
jgi:hypothetical protein